MFAAVGCVVKYDFNVQVYILFTKFLNLNNVTLPI